MRALFSIAITVLIGLGIVAAAADVLQQWSVARNSPAVDRTYEPPSQAERR